MAIRHDGWIGYLNDQSLLVSVYNKFIHREQQWGTAADQHFQVGETEQALRGLFESSQHLEMMPHTFTVTPDVSSVFTDPAVVWGCFVPADQANQKINLTLKPIQCQVGENNTP